MNVDLKAVYESYCQLCEQTPEFGKVAKYDEFSSEWDSMTAEGRSSFLKALFQGQAATKEGGAEMLRLFTSNSDEMFSPS